MRFPHRFFVLALSTLIAALSPALTHAATIAVNPGDNIQSRLDSAHPGDVLQFAAGTFTTTSPLTIHKQLDLEGAGNCASHIVMKLNAAVYGMQIESAAGLTTFNNFDLISTNGVIGCFSVGPHEGIKFTNNRVTHGGGSTSNGTAIFGLYASVGGGNWAVTGNLFHDTFGTNRSWELWGLHDSDISYNTFDHIQDGGHFCAPGNNNRFVSNYYTHLRRCAQEVQGDVASSGLTFDGCIVADYDGPFFDSYGFSVVNHFASNTTIKNCYFNGKLAPGASMGVADNAGNKRYAYGLEAGGLNFQVQNCIFAGDYVCGVCASRKNIIVTGCKAFGGFAWGGGNPWSGEGGVDGNGTCLVANSTSDKNSANAPAVPKNPNKIPGVGTAPVVVPPVVVPPVVIPPVVVPPVTTKPAATIVGLSVTVLSNNSVKLSWTNELTGAVANIVSTVGRQAFPAVKLPDGQAATVVFVHPGWQLDFSVSTANGSSDVKTVQMPGDGSAAVTSNPKAIAKITTQTVTTYTDGTTDVTPASP